MDPWRRIPLAAVAAGARLVDVRTARSFSAGHIDDALRIAVDQVQRRSKEIGPTS